MKQLTRHILTIIACLYVTVMFAQKQTPPPGGQAKDFKLPQKKTKSLANGLRTTMVQYGDVPKVSISLIIKTGNVHEAPDKIWLADLTGEMMKQGTTKFDFKTLAKKAAQMGGQLNINVGMDQTSISGSVLSEYAADFIKLSAEVVMDPVFPEADLERIKGDLKRQLNVQKAVPQVQAREKFLSAMYKGHRYATFFPTEQMITSYNLQMVKDFYNNNFGAKRSVLYVVGKYDEASVTAAVSSAYSKWKAGPEVLYTAVPVASSLDTFVIDRKNAPQTTVFIGLPALTPKDKDYVQQVVTNSLLGGSFGSRITSNIRENKGYTYSPRSSVQNRQGTSLWIEQADVTSEHTMDALKEIENEIRRLQAEPPSKEELAGIQNYEAGIFVLNNSSPDDIIQQLNFLDQYGLDDSYLTNFVKNIYAVTPADVSAMAKKNLIYEKMTLVMVGDKESIEKQRSKAN